MPEGLSHVEVGKELAEHAEHEREKHEKAEAETNHGVAEEHDEERRERRRNEAISIVEAAMLAVVAVLAAWSGYAAAKWSTESSLHLAKASASRNAANLSALQGLNALNFDLNAFNVWFEAYVAHNRPAMAIAERRFTPNFERAFRAWLADNPETNPLAAPGPTYMPQYQQPDKVQTAALNTTAAAEYAAGAQAGSNSDGYILTTVYLATVLFLAGIGSHFKYRNIRYGLASVASVILVVAIVLLATAPKPPT